MGQAWAAIMAVLFLPVYIEYLGIEAYGLIGVFAVLQTILLLLDIGMAPTLNREMALYSTGSHSAISIRNLLRTIEIISIGMGILIAIMVWNASVYLANTWLNIEDLPYDVVVDSVILMGVVISFRFIEGIYRGSLYGLERQVFYNVSYAALNTLRYGGAVAILAFISNSIVAFFMWQAVISIVSVLIFSYGVYKSMPVAGAGGRFSMHALSGVWKYAAGMLGVAILTMLLLHIDKIMLSTMVSLKEFGVYSLSATAAGILFMVVVPVTQAVFPRLVQLEKNNDSQGLENLYHLTTQIVVVLIVPLALVVNVFAGDVIYIWSGSDDLSRASSPLLSLLIIGCLFNGLAHIPYQLQLAQGNTIQLVKVNLLIVVMLLTMLYFLVPVHGALGAAWAWLISNALYLGVSAAFLHERLSSNGIIRWCFVDILLPAAGVCAVVCFALMFIYLPDFDRPYQLLFLSLIWVVATILAIALAPLLKKQLIPGGWQIFRERA